MRPRILIISDTLPPDPNGVAVIAQRTASILAEHQDVHLFGPEGLSAPGVIEQTFVRRTQGGTPDIRLPERRTWQLARAIWRTDRVAVHSLGPLGCAALVLGRLLRRPTIFFVHNDLPELLAHGLEAGRFRPWMRVCSKWLQAVACAFAHEVVAPKRLARPTDRTLQLLPPKAPPAPASRRRGKAFIVAYHGRISREKGLDAVVAALGQLLEFKPVLYLVGRGSELPALQDQAHQLGVTLVHQAWCEHPTDFLVQADAYVMASRTETYSLATLEALGCGLPVVARRVGEIPNYIDHMKNGLLFDVDHDLPAALRLLARDSQLRLRLGDAARANACEGSVWAQFAAASLGCSPLARDVTPMIRRPLGETTLESAA